MTPPAEVSTAVVGMVEQLPIDQGYLRHVVTTLTAIGSSAQGFRTTGTPEDIAVARFVAQEMRVMGLTDVAVEPVDVDAWRFHSASLTLPATPGRRAIICRAVSFGGVPATDAAGVTAPLVDIGDGRRLTTPADVSGALVLLDWRDADVHPPPRCWNSPSGAYSAWW